MAHSEKYGKYWYVRYKDESGQWKRKACGIKANRSDADYIANEYSAKELNHHHKAPVRLVSLTLPDAMRQFKDKELLRSPLGIDKQESSIKREKATVNNIIAFVENKGLLKFNGFDNEMAERYMDERKGLGIMPKTLKEELRLLRKFFKWAIKRHYCSNNPTSELVAPKLEKKHPRYFLKEELMKIFELARNPYRSIFMFLFLTGLRTGELCNLEWRDYNKDLRTLTIRIVSADRKKRTPGNKCKREETIPLSDDAINILEDRKRANDSPTFIFLNHAGHRLDNDNIYRNLQPVLKEANIKNAKPHTFRHSFASHLVIMGVSIYIVKELLRHASVKETEIYAHLSKETTQNAVKKLTLASLKTSVTGEDTSSQSYQLMAELKKAPTPVNKPEKVDSRIALAASA